MFCFQRRACHNMGCSTSSRATVKEPSSNNPHQSREVKKQVICCLDFSTSTNGYFPRSVLPCFASFRWEITREWWYLYHVCLIYTYSVAQWKQIDSCRRQQNLKDHLYPHEQVQALPSVFIRGPFPHASSDVQRWQHGNGLLQWWPPTHLSLYCATHLFSGVGWDLSFLLHC